MIISLWRYVSLYICTLDRLKEDAEDSEEGGDKATTQKRAKKSYGRTKTEKELKKIRDFQFLLFI